MFMWVRVCSSHGETNAATAVKASYVLFVRLLGKIPSRRPPSHLMTYWVAHMWVIEDPVIPLREDNTSERGQYLWERSLDRDSSEKSASIATQSSFRSLLFTTSYYLLFIDNNYNHSQVVHSSWVTLLHTWSPSQSKGVWAEDCIMPLRGSLVHLCSCGLVFALLMVKQTLPRR
jgi:hypothetical protein